MPKVIACYTATWNPEECNRPHKVRMPYTLKPQHVATKKDDVHVGLCWLFMVFMSS